MSYSWTVRGYWTKCWGYGRGVALGLPSFFSSFFFLLSMHKVIMMDSHLRWEKTCWTGSSSVKLPNVTSILELISNGLNSCSTCDKHFISPININTLSSKQVTKIDNLITDKKQDSHKQLQRNVKELQGENCLSHLWYEKVEPVFFLLTGEDEHSSIPTAVPSGCVLCLCQAKRTGVSQYCMDSRVHCSEK